MTQVSKKILPNDSILSLIIRTVIGYPFISTILFIVMLTALSGYVFAGTYVDSSCGCASGGFYAIAITLIVSTVAILIIGNATTFGKKLYEDRSSYGCNGSYESTYFQYRVDCELNGTEPICWYQI